MGENHVKGREEPEGADVGHPGAKPHGDGGG
jgi:hypothetical protein